MNKVLEPITLSLAECEQDIDAFKSLLDTQAELSEGKDILPFFRSHPHLAAMIGSISLHVHKIDRACHEFDLFGNFRCDWAVGDYASRSYTLIEFEDARRNSVFAAGEKYHEEWGRRFEHGFSQLVDWFWAIDAYRGNPDFCRRFGDGPAQFFGILIVGRRAFLTPAQEDRMKWRLDRVTINTSKITCITFDELYDLLRKRLAFIRGIADRGNLS
jgi:Domain of unknown function (DUF4263)